MEGRRPIRQRLILCGVVESPHNPHTHWHVPQARIHKIEDEEGIGFTRNLRTVLSFGFILRLICVEMDEASADPADTGILLYCHIAMSIG
jgi:hypothetical protein